MNTVLGDTPYPALNNGLEAGDPFTPMIRAQSGDTVKVKIQSGAHEHEHNASVQGVKWLQSGSSHGEAPNSGWRNAQSDGISEQFTFTSPVVDTVGAPGGRTDRFYSVDMSQDGFWSGMWGLMRTYSSARNDLYTMPNGMRGNFIIGNANEFNGVCPRTAPVRSYDLTAAVANDILGNAVGATIVPGDLSATMHEGGPLDPAGGTLVYNPRPTAIQQFDLTDDAGNVIGTVGGQSGPLHDPTAMMLVRTSDLGADGKLRPGAPVEPVVLRAAAGECLEVTVRNNLPTVAPDLAGWWPPTWPGQAVPPWAPTPRGCPWWRRAGSGPSATTPVTSTSCRTRRGTAGRPTAG